MDAPTPEAALRKAISLAGSQSKLAAICGCTQAAISQMLARAEPMLSAQYALRVEEALGIPRHISRPDFYPAPEAANNSIAA